MAKSPKFTRNGEASILTFDSESSTIEVCFAAGEPVKRQDYSGQYIEELAVDLKSIRQRRLNSGAMSVLDSHESYGMDNRVGVVLANSIRIEGGKAYATVQISRHGRGENLLKDLEDGMPFPVSVGYRIHAYEETEGKGDTLPRRVITDWEPLELSAVPIPADAGATSRSIKKVKNMPKQVTIDTPDTDPADEIIERHDIDAAEDQRVSSINALAKRLKVDVSSKIVRSAIVRGQTYDEFRETLLDDFTRQDSRIQTNHAGSHRQGDSGVTENQAMENAIVARSLPDTKLDQRSEQFRSSSLMQICRVIASRNDSSLRNASNSEVVKRALSSGDFPQILGNAFNRVLRERHAAAPAALKRIGTKATIADFRKKNSLGLSGAGFLEPKAEDGEYKYGYLTENGNAYALTTLGKILKLTRESIINDDLNAFAAMQQIMVNAAGATEAILLVDLLMSNPVMGDSTALFHASHGNLAAAGSALSLASLSAARLAMRKQTGIANDLISVEPKFLVVGPELETTAEQILSQIAATKTADVNPFGGKLELIVEPRIIGTRWYMAADPLSAPGLEYAYLDGQEGPSVETNTNFYTDAAEFKCRLDFGAGFVDHRGWYMNPGV